MTNSDLVLRMTIATMAVHSPRQAVYKGLLFLVMINATAIGLEVFLLGGLDRGVLLDIALTSLIASPFITLVFYVVTRLDRLQRELVKLASTDVLTGLPNRRAFLTRTRSAVAAADKGVILVIDADYFKAINDHYGHAVGDTCLQAIAVHLRKIVRDIDVVGRLGGEEFGAYLPGAPRQQAIEIGERISRALQVEIDGLDGQVELTLSVGAAETAPGYSLDHFLNLADIALYKAKQAGRARIVMWDETMVEAA